MTTIERSALPFLALCLAACDAAWVELEPSAPAAPLAGYITGTVIPVDGGLRRYQF